METKITIDGEEKVAARSARTCKICGTAKGSFHKCCKACGVTNANGFDEITELFGWRKHHKFPATHVMPQGQCRSCRSSKVSDVSTLTVPVSPVVSAAKPAVASAAAKSLHVRPDVATVAFAGNLAPIKFGPFAITPNSLNTVDGASMVPALDPHYRFDVDEAVVLANAILNAENTWVWGASGTGKTSGITQICALLNRPLYRLNMSGDVSLDDLVGSTQVVIDPASGKAVTSFSYGLLVRAMLAGGVFLIDEVTSAPPSVLMALQQVAEPCDNVHAKWKAGEAHAKFVVSSNEGETIHAAEGFRLIVTDNTNGQGDVSGLFAGTLTMNEAFRSRFSQWIEKTFPSSEDWRTLLINKTGVTPADAKSIVDVASAVNKGSAAFGALAVTNNLVVNPRDTLAVARLAVAYGDLKAAWKVGVVGSIRSDDPDRAFLLNLVKNVCK